MYLYRADIKSDDVSKMGICAIDKRHAAELTYARMIECGYKPGEFAIERLYRDGKCSWDIGNTLIYC